MLSGTPLYMLSGTPLQAGRQRNAAINAWSAERRYMTQRRTAAKNSEQLNTHAQRNAAVRAQRNTATQDGGQRNTAT